MAEDTQAQGNPNLGEARPNGDAPVGETAPVAEVASNDVVPSEGQSSADTAPVAGTDAPVEGAPVDNAGDTTGAVAGEAVQ